MPMIRHRRNLNGGAARFLRFVTVVMSAVVSGHIGTQLVDPSPVFAAGPPPARQWAILIAVEKYHRATPLRFTVNDVKQLAATLRTRGGLDADTLLEITDASKNARFQPFKTSVQTELAEWLKKPGPNDQILVYFSGHGFRDAAGKLYLAPIDCDPANPAETGIPVEWFREQVAACRAGLKLLILDACHAGSEKGDEDRASVNAKDLGDPFEGLEKVITLASSSADEKSQIWEDRQQSLFSYWLNQGLKGHADNGDGEITIDELYGYVERHVKHTANLQFPRPQSPRRVIRAAVDGNPVVLRLQPQSLKQVLADLAERLALSLEENRLNKAGVLEFVCDTPFGDRPGPGSLGKYCADEIEHRLVEVGTGKFSVVDRRRLQSSLTAQGFEADDLASGAALEKLSSRAGGLPVIVQGRLQSREGRIVSFHCKLIQTGRDELAGSAGGIARLTESEWVMLGKSGRVTVEDRRPPYSVQTAIPSQASEAVADQVVSALDARAQEAHPLQDPNFPFRIWFDVGTQIDANGQLIRKKRDLVFSGNDCLLPVRKGEMFEIHVENKTGEIVLMRLLVDGLNTLPEKETDTKGIVTYHWGEHVNLDKAREWVLDPRQANHFAVRGFTTKVGANGEMRRFTVTDAERSLAARRKFTEQLGLITVAFYAPSGTSRGSLGIAEGAPVQQDLTVRKGVNCGNLLAGVNIRYVDADEIQR